MCGILCSGDGCFISQYFKEAEEFSMRYLFLILLSVIMIVTSSVSAVVVRTYPFDIPELTQWNRDLDGKSGQEIYSIVQLKDAPLAGDPGAPLIPHRPVSLLIPQGEELEYVEVHAGEWISIPGTHFLAPSQRVYPLSHPEQIQLTAPDAAIYASSDVYPGVTHSAPKTFWSMGYQIVTFNLFPVTYIPSEKKLHRTDRMDVILHTKPIEKSVSHVRCRALPEDQEWVRRKVDNPDAVDTYLAEPPIRESLLNDRDDYQYVIITTTALANAGGPNNYQDFLAFKSTRGISGTIQRVEQIYSMYPGANNQEKIRNFCIDAYENWNAQYILLGADHAGVPTRGCYATAEGHEDSTIPTDMFYGCLDGTWDYSGDGIYGEMGDGPDGGDVDVFAELFIGRASVDSSTELHNFVAKTITYETDNYTQEWADNALLLGEYLWTDTYGGDYMDELWYGSDAWGYSTPPYPSSWDIDHLYEREGSWGSSQLLPRLNSNNLFWVNHLGHANESTVMHLYTSDVDGLTNSRPFLVYSQGCYAGAFDTTDCIAEHFSWTAHGAFAVMMNGRYGWGEIGCTDGPSQYFHRQFHDAYFSENIKEIGRMNQDSKEDNVWCLDYKANRWCCYELNLLGCPQTPINGLTTTRGTMMFDRTKYGQGDVLEAIVTDVDLNTDPSTPQSTTIQLRVASGSDAETLVLTETGPNTCRFEGTIPVINASYQPGNHQLDVREGDIITGTYTDAADGFGGTQISVVDTATVDFSVPLVENVHVEYLDDHHAMISWDSSEPSRGRVVFDVETPPAAFAQTDAGLNTHHVITLSDLEQCLDYFFYVESIDDAGNRTIDDAGGLYYSFTTRVRMYVLNASMDTDPGWTISGGDWEWGQPTGQPSGPGADPVAGFDGPNIYGTNLHGAYQTGSAYHLITPPLDCSAATGTRLSFYQWLDVVANDQDHASISVSNNGTDWTIIYESPASNLYDYRWALKTFDISGIADGQPEVYIRWTMGPAVSGSVGGWNIDNVEVSYPAPCNVPILIHQTHEIDDSSGNHDGQISPLEQIRMPVTIRNVGLDATHVIGHLTTVYPHVIISEDSSEFGAIAQGGSAVSLTDFVFAAQATAGDGDVIPFRLDWTSSETFGTAAFTHEIIAPRLEFHSVTIDDSGMNGDGDGILDPGETVVLNVSIENNGRLSATDVSGILSAGDPFITINEDQSQFPDIIPQSAATCLPPYYTVTADMSTPDHTMTPFTLEIDAYGHSAQIHFDLEVTTSSFARRYNWDMDTDPGWTTTGQWEYGQPQGNAGDPTCGYTGDYVYGYNLAGAYEDNLAAMPLTSHAINCANYRNIQVKFARWLGIESSTWDHASFQVSNDGTTWHTIWDHSGSSFADTEWIPQTFDISEYADGEPTVYLRWVMGTTDGSVTYCGWNIDDVEIWAEMDEPRPVLVYSDHTIDDSAGNQDGHVNPTEPIYMDVTVENMGIAGTHIVGFLSSTNPHVSIIDNQASFPDMSAFGIATTLTPFQFSVNANAMDGDAIEFILTYFSDQGNGSLIFQEEVYAAQLAFSSVSVLDFSGDSDGILDPGESAQIQVTLHNAGRMAVEELTGTLSSGSPEYIVINTGSARYPEIPIGGSGSTLPPFYSISTATFTPEDTQIMFEIMLYSDNYTGVIEFSLPVTQSNFARRFMWNMDTNPGWNCEGQWAWGQPQGAAGDPDSAYTGNMVYGYNLAGAYPNNLSEMSLTSGPVNCSGLESVEVRFMRWLGVESATWDHASLRVSTNGTIWTTVWEHSGNTLVDTAWQAQAFDISAIADDQSTVYLRWVMGTTDSSVVYCGWNIDDVEIWAESNQPISTPTPTPTSTPEPECIHDGDVNFNGSITAGDAQLAFRITLGAYSPSYAEWCAADCNGNGFITAGDAQGIFGLALGIGSCADPLE